MIHKIGNRGESSSQSSNIRSMNQVLVTDHSNATNIDKVSKLDGLLGKKLLGSQKRIEVQPKEEKPPASRLDDKTYEILENSLSKEFEEDNTLVKDIKSRGSSPE